MCDLRQRRSASRPRHLETRSGDGSGSAQMRFPLSNSRGVLFLCRDLLGTCLDGASSCRGAWGPAGEGGADPQ